MQLDAVGMVACILFRTVCQEKAPINIGDPSRRLQLAKLENVQRNGQNYSRVTIWLEIVQRKLEIRAN